jgi:hypothetical protein
VVRDGSGHVLYGFGMVEDVTEQRRAEALLVREKAVLEAIAAGAPLPAALDGLCRLVESQGEGLLCSVLLLDPDGLHLRHGAAPASPAYVRATGNLPPAPRRLVRTAYRRGRSVFDIAAWTARAD